MGKPTTNRVQRATFALMVLRYKQQLGLAIRARRLELGLSQKDLAEAAHVKEPQTVSRWERGETAPSDLQAVAAALRWTIPQLMAGMQPPLPAPARRPGIAPAPEPTLGDVMSAIGALEERLQLLQAELAKRDAEVLRQTGA